MKTLIRIFFLLSSVLIVSQSATRGDVKIIEASENIRYISQLIAKDYLFYYLHPYPQKSKIVDRLDKLLEELNDNFRIIALASKDIDTKDILGFLAYNKDEIKEIIHQDSDDEKSALILDYSETLVEGADSISSAYSYNFTKEENMWMVSKKIIYLLERINKYYMAINSGFDNITNREQLEESIVAIEANMQIINSYNYPQLLQKERTKMNKAWEENKMFINKSNRLFIPVLMFTSIEYLENIIDKISLYHSKN